MSFSSEDIRDQLRRDHWTVLAELDALRSEADERAVPEKLAGLRRSWVIHALCVETVVFPALAGVEHATSSEDMGRKFALAREKLTLLEEMKAEEAKAA